MTQKQFFKLINGARVEVIHSAEEVPQGKQVYMRGSLAGNAYYGASVWLRVWEDARVWRKRVIYIMPMNA